MAGPKDVILAQFANAEQLMQWFTSDLSDAEYFKPPVPGANHAGWIIGHVACSEDSIVAAITGKAMCIPAATHATFKGGEDCLPDAARYPSRKQVDELLRDSRAHTREAIRDFDDKRWNDPSPEGWTKEFFPTLGAMWSLLPTHQYWHIGQITVCRTGLRKKRVFPGG
ncbi:MAG: DinB family protein [Planctomycetota bacterium]